MSSPVSADLSANTPSAALGDPSAVQPPQIGIGSRGSSRRRSHGLLSGDLSRRGVKAPFSTTQRERAAAAAHAIRKESAPAPAPAAPPADRPRTAAGAPVRAPREIPKREDRPTERERDAVRDILSKDARRFHSGINAAAQDQMNKYLRAHGDIAARAGNDAIVERLRALRAEDLRYRREQREAARGRRPPSDDPETRAAREAINLQGLGTPGRRGQAATPSQPDPHAVNANAIFQRIRGAVNQPPPTP